MKWFLAVLIAINLIVVSWALNGLTENHERLGLLEKAVTRLAEKSDRDFEEAKLADLTVRLAYQERRQRGMKPAGEKVLEVLSEPFHVTQIYKSMLGPFYNKPVKLLEGAAPELLWVTGYQVEVVGEDGRTPDSNEFFCHANLDLVDVEDYVKRHRGVSQENDRLFTLTQGQQSVRLPKGFGIPMLSDQTLLAATQVLNLNRPKIDKRLRHRFRIWFLRDAELTEAVQPVFQSAVQGLKALGEATHFGMDPTARPGDHGAGCSIGKSPKDTKLHELDDDRGHPFTGHWEVEPGREVNHTNVTRWFRLRYDTTVHFIGVHLHPYAETFELRDLTAQRTIFKAKARQPRGRVGLEFIEAFSNAAGINLLKDHEYEVISVYNNPTKEKSDAMASMFLYLADQRYLRPLLR